MTVCCVSADNKKSRLNKLNNSVDSHTKVDNVILVWRCDYNQIIYYY